MVTTAYRIIGENRPSRWLVTCDHASNRVPADIAGGSLGLSPADMDRHIAYDPGAAGLAVSFVSAATEGHFRLIEKRVGRRVPREQVPGFEPTETAVPAPAAGGVKGRRPSKKDKLRART